MRKKQTRLAGSLGALATAVLALAFAQPALADPIPCEWMMCSSSCYSGQCDLECTNECYVDVCYLTYDTGCLADE